MEHTSTMQPTGHPPADPEAREVPGAGRTGHQLNRQAAPQASAVVRKGLSQHPLAVPS